jgi:hypothetical protein
VSITVGDGGNVEGTYKDFVDTAYSAAKFDKYCNSGNTSGLYAKTWNRCAEMVTVGVRRPAMCTQALNMLCIQNRVVVSLATPAQQ